jgi:lysophospholipase L1-like esterase
LLPSQPSRRHNLQPGQTLIFVGDHTTPDAPGYLLVVNDVLARFYPQMNLRLISAGSKGQSPAGLRSQTLLELVGSSRPDYLVIGVGLSDAEREPVVPRLIEAYRKKVAERDDAFDSTFGPEHHVHFHEDRPVSDSGRIPEIELTRLPRFLDDLRAAVGGLRDTGVGVILMTPALTGNDLDFPINSILQAYARGIRRLGEEMDVPVVDLEQAFRNIFDRAANYKQRAILSSPQGSLNAQGQTLIARTFLGTFDLLPGPGFRK